MLMEPDSHLFRRKNLGSNIEENTGGVNGVNPLFFI